MLPIIALAIGAAGSYLSSRARAKSSKEAAAEANKDRTPPELQALRKQLAEYYSEKGMEGTPYPGQLTAAPNPVLTAAMQSAMQNRNAGSGMLNDLLSRFGSPSGATGWSPTSTFSNRGAVMPTANAGRTVRTRSSNDRVSPGGGP